MSFLNRVLIFAFSWLRGFQEERNELFENVQKEKNALEG